MSKTSPRKAARPASTFVARRRMPAAIRAKVAQFDTVAQAGIASLHQADALLFVLLQALSSDRADKINLPTLRRCLFAQAEYIRSSINVLTVIQRFAQEELEVANG